MLRLGATPVAEEINVQASAVAVSLGKAGLGYEVLCGGSGLACAFGHQEDVSWGYAAEPGEELLDLDQVMFSGDDKLELSAWSGVGVEQVLQDGEIQTTGFVARGDYAGWIARIARGR